MRSIITLLSIILLITPSCNKDENNLPTLPASEVLGVSCTLAEVRGFINSFEIEDLKQCGHCWSTSPNPTVGDNISRIKEIPESMSFSTTILNLEANTTYYVKSYIVTNDFETAYGKEVKFTTSGDEVINFTNSHFKQALLERHNIDTNNDGEISTIEAEAYTEKINISNWKDKGNIDNISEIKHFTNAKGLNCSNNYISELDISKNIMLTELACDSNLISNIKLNSAIRTLKCTSNNLSNLDLNNNTYLITLYCQRNPELKEIDLSKNLKLMDFFCGATGLSKLDVSNNSKLLNMNCALNELTELDISKNTELLYLICSGNQLTELDVRKCEKLRVLYCTNNKIECISKFHDQNFTYKKDNFTRFCTTINTDAN